MKTTDFDDLYIKLNIDNRVYNILCFNYLPVKVIIDFYDSINDVEDFTRSALKLINMSLKNPKEFNSIKTKLTFDELYETIEQWVKRSMYYSLYRSGKINSDGEIYQNIKLKDTIAHIVAQLESDNITDDEEHLLFIELLTETIKKHVKAYNTLVDTKPITKITIEAE